MKYLMACTIIVFTLLTSPAMADIGQSTYMFKNQHHEKQSSHLNDYDDRYLETETELNTRLTKHVRNKLQR